MKRINLSALVAYASFFGVAILFYLHFSGKSKVAFVRSNELVYGYEGMKEAHLLQEEKTRQYQTNLDTLRLDFQKALSDYQQGLSGFSKEERIAKEKMLAMQQENLKRYSAGVEESIQKNDQDLTQGILNQINSFVEVYAKKHHYSLIFGTTSSGNILYGEPVIDITDEVLKQLNEQYKNPPKSDEKME